MLEDSITVQFRPTAADYRSVLIWYQWRRFAIILGVVLTAMFLIGISVIRPTPTEPYKRLPIYLAVAISPFLLTAFAYRGLSRQAKKLEAISDDTRFTFSSEGLESTTALASASVKWERFKKVAETQKYFVFFPQDNVFYVVPKRSFESKDRLENFKLILKNRLGDRAKLRA